tara:strand:- start:15974 stop:17044 length:1071 start_codon:yes stop_codon:yes gene_type:complete
MLFNDIYKDKVCLVTGHTGFKGSWLAHWLNRMGAQVIGYSLKSQSTPNHFELLQSDYTSIIGDIRDLNHLEKVFNKYKPNIVFHLAAQALVRYSYDAPLETIQTNIIGTSNILELSRKCKSVEVVINVTSDKCYENKEISRGYNESDRMGGHDPYSSSKGCSELITSSYQNSFYKTLNKSLASVRAGNVIGGGDWASDRIIPDLVKSASTKEVTYIRNPIATRPWQHVLEPLSGYLTLGWRLYEKYDYNEGWNFGPYADDNLSVKEIVNRASKFWERINFKIEKKDTHYHEANLLMLDCSKANNLLKWKPVWGINQALDKTINWYKDYYEYDKINTNKDLDQFIADAKRKFLIWTK